MHIFSTIDFSFSTFWFPTKIFFECKFEFQNTTDCQSHDKMTKIK